jgi:hypothetical protein
MSTVAAQRRSKMEMITLEQYGQAIIKMINLAHRDCSSSAVAAKVLLSAYNGHDWQISIPELCSLDHSNFQSALNVIRGRVELRIEPQHLIEDGRGQFRALWKQYSNY